MSVALLHVTPAAGYRQKSCDRSSLWAPSQQPADGRAFVCLEAIIGQQIFRRRSNMTETTEVMN